jgi:hypothetical protein
MFDEGGARHGRMTTNTIVDIIEFFLYRTMKYFPNQTIAADQAMPDNQKVYRGKMIEYMDQAQKRLFFTVPVCSTMSASKLSTRLSFNEGAKVGRDQAQKTCPRVRTLTNDMCIFSC